MTAPGVTEAREAAITATLDLLGVERHLHDRASAAARLTGVQDAFYIACRDVTNAVDALPPNLRPRNWTAEPETRTA